MHKRVFLVILAAVCIVLSACSSANEYGLTFNSDGTDKMEYIHYTDDCIVYVVGGLMMAEIDGEPKMLEMALSEGDITVEDILASASADAENGDIELTEYPDGSVEYNYGSFVLIKLNTVTSGRDIYFVPSGMTYYDVAN